MKYMKWLGVLAVGLLIYSCFSNWIAVTDRGVIAGGMDAGGTNFGKPGYFHLFFALLFLPFHLIPRLWAKRANVVVVALNMAWAIRNFFVLAICRGGDCPERLLGLWLMLLASVLMLLAALFPDMNPVERK